ncbi:hypothetical protein HHL11_24085 [Ramlibacter sp. G-1-2-2]|uniref:Uncharacterized protein n=1 Tax=Ramlibacter agri TaxID=2728837 RepID=A0A848H777_9BURK|nr:hypothetical protein [Ramlibacter agri]NML46846.1 hypothetical protein [Ramlibacter agri]
MKAERPVALHIERLVLEGLGFTPAQGALVQRAMERELTRLAARPGPWQAGAQRVAAAPALRLAGPPQPARVGRELARSLFATLRGAP